MGRWRANEFSGLYEKIAAASHPEIWQHWWSNTFLRNLLLDKEFVMY